MSKGNFKRSNAHGSMAEKAIQTILEENGISCIKDTKTKLEHDLIAAHNGHCFTIEAKYDMMARLTGNIAIEYRNSKKGAASGLFGTTADFWAIMISVPNGHEVYMTSTSKLLNFVFNTDPHKIIQSGGDDNADLFLYKKNIILPIFSLISDLTSVEIKRIFNEYSNSATSAS